MRKINFCKPFRLGWKCARRETPEFQKFNGRKPYRPECNCSRRMNFRNLTDGNHSDRNANIQDTIISAIRRAETISTRMQMFKTPEFQKSIAIPTFINGWKPFRLECQFSTYEAEDIDGVRTRSWIADTGALIYREGRLTARPAPLFNL